MTRHYLVGLPVTISVLPDGSVVYTIDKSEAGAALFDAVNDEAFGYTEQEVIDDREAVERDYQEYGS